MPLEYGSLESGVEPRDAGETKKYLVQPVPIALWQKYETVCQVLPVAAADRRPHCAAALNQDVVVLHTNDWRMLDDCLRGGLDDDGLISRSIDRRLIHVARAGRARLHRDRDFAVDRWRRYRDPARWRNNDIACDSFDLSWHVDLAHLLFAVRSDAAFPADTARVGDDLLMDALNHRWLVHV